MQKIIALAAAVLLCSWPAVAAPIEFTTMRLDAAQAYIPWAMPLDGGPLRALLVAPRYTIRDADNLKQRMGLDLETVPLTTRDSLGSEEERQSTLADLEKALKRRLDVIIVANIEAAILPDAFWKAVADRVELGAGLVLANHDLEGAPVLHEWLRQSTPAEDLRPLTRGIAEQITPEWTSGLEFLHASTSGEGRIAVLDYGPERPRTHALLPALLDPLLAFPEFLDTYYSLVIKAVRWAGGRTPPLYVEGLRAAGPAGPREEEIPPQLPEEYVQRMRDAAIPFLLHPHSITFSAPADQDYELRVQTRRLGRSHEEIFVQNLHLAKGATSLSLDLYGGAGQYLVDIWLLTRQGVAEWHTELVSLEGWPELNSLHFSKDFILPNDAIDIRFDVRPHFAQPRPCTLYARAIDLHGRRVAEVTQQISEAGGKAVVTLPFADVLTPLLKVEVYLVDAPARPFADWELNAAAFEYLYVAVLQSPSIAQADLAVMAPAAYEYNAQFYLQRLAEAGVTAAYVPFHDGLSWPVAAAGLDAITEVAEYCSEFEEGMALPCLSDPAFRAAETARLQAVARFAGSGGAPRMSLGLANCIGSREGQFCQSPHCLARLREALEAHYGGLSELNDAWGAAFAAWDQVAPLAREEAIANGRLAAVLDLMRFEEDVFTEHHAFAQQQIHLTAPQARVGFQPADQRDADWRKLAQQHTLMMAAADPLVECALQSWRQQGSWQALSWSEAGLQRESTRLSWMVWHSLVNQIPGTLYLPAYGLAGTTGSDSLLTPAGDPAAEFQSLFDTIRRVRQGIAPLLLEAEPPRARVALFDSALDRRYAATDPALPVGYRESQRAWIQMLQALGYAVRLIAPDEILAGGLSQSDLLILSQARALEAEVEAKIAEWATAGHTLIADLAPRVYTPMGLRPSTLFPVQIAGPGEAAGLTAVDIQIAHEDAVAGAHLPAVIGDGQVQAGEMLVGNPPGDLPLWLHAADSRGSRLLLNHLLSSDRALHDAILPVLQRWLDASGVAAELPLYDSPKRRFHGQAAQFRYGAADIYAFLRDCDEFGSEKVVLELGKGNAVHDLVNEISPPRPRKLAVKLGPGEAAVYSVLPYDVDALTLIVPEQILQGQRLEFSLHVETDEKAPGRHLVQVELIPALRPPLEHYRQFVTCETGHGRGYMPLALNEATGRYTLRARDLLSGRTAEAVLDIEARQTAQHIE